MERFEGRYLGRNPKEEAAMAKTAAGWRLDDRTIDLVRSFAAHLRVTQVQLVDNAITAAARTHAVATKNHNAAWRELNRRCGPDALVTVRIVEGEDDRPEAVVLVDGEERDDVRAHLVQEPERLYSHVFIEVVGYCGEEAGTVRIGHDILLTRPLLAAAKLPWPVDSSMVLSGRLGELVLEEAGRL